MSELDEGHVFFHSLFSRRLQHEGNTVFQRGLAVCWVLFLTRLTDFRLNSVGLTG